MELNNAIRKARENNIKVLCLIPKNKINKFQSLTRISYTDVTDFNNYMPYDSATTSFGSVYVPTAKSTHASNCGKENYTYSCWGGMSSIVPYVRSGMSGRWFDHFRWILQAGQWNSLSFRVYFCNVRNAGVSDHQSWRDHRRTDWEWWEKLGIGFCADLCYNIANREAIPQNYWINTSSNAEVKEFIRQSKNLTTKREIERLMSGESITKTIYPELTYKEMYFWNMGLRVIWNGVR